jgi:hypothetical protein
MSGGSTAKKGRIEREIAAATRGAAGEPCAGLWIEDRGGYTHPTKDFGREE